MKIGIIGHLKHPIAKPFAGGLETFTDSFVRSLAKRGHDVTLFASGDSDPILPLVSIIKRATVPDSKRRLQRVHHEWIESVENEAYASLMAGLAASNFDVIHNHTLSPLPLAFASTLPMPMITTLHTPPLPRMVDELAVRGSDNSGAFVNISNANAERWQSCISQQTIIYNGVDTSFWKKCHQPKQRRAIWFGRILADKGPHHAIDAAHAAGLPIDIAGPVADSEYFDREIQPRLQDTDCYHGHLTHEALCGLISRSAVALVTPCWDEPFGLVVAEALACGTPVAGFARGALPELITPAVGRLARPGDSSDLARAALQCIDINGLACRRIAQKRFGFQRMVDQYESLYARHHLEAAA
ncbi:glycosyltransferase family 4 protein [Crateriforma conspicua]|uniref:Glycogen synthase n=1 Tax=Crateriforma conspicua TaxID=2527996 RepID=A0A5C5Y1K1_9PLAN|nr:glycosyltransferase family 4 protein [Crateriforma conspicua]TWT68523.1 Glycogen synthase [Crateriforma conspicua]